MIGFLCDYLRFKPKLLFKKIRGKRLMFVGDSLNRNQWESMVCMVQSVVPSDKKTWYKTGSLAILKIEVCPFPFFHLGAQVGQINYSHIIQLYFSFNFAKYY
jgi:hypothetical protein